MLPFCFVELCCRVIFGVFMRDNRAFRDNDTLIYYLLNNNIKKNG